MIRLTGFSDKQMLPLPLALGRPTIHGIGAGIVAAINSVVVVVVVEVAAMAAMAHWHMSVVTRVERNGAALAEAEIALIVIVTDGATTARRTSQQTWRQLIGVVERGGEREADGAESVTENTNANEIECLAGITVRGM